MGIRFEVQYSMWDDTSSEHSVDNNGDVLIISFGGKTSGLNKLPFEFSRCLTAYYGTTLDMTFYVDPDQCWYHKGIRGLTSSIDDTVAYLTAKIRKRNYKKVIFIGVSAGGYAALLFGSLCKVSHVIAFIAQTKLQEPVDHKYGELTKIINSTTKYTLYANPAKTDANHHISHALRIASPPNVRLITATLTMPELKRSNMIKTLIDDILAS